MAGRTTLANIRARVRLLINDAGTVLFTDEQMDQHLDQRRRDFWHEPMAPIHKYTAGGTIQYLDYQVMRRNAPVGDVESTQGGTAVFWLNDGTGSTVGTAIYALDEVAGLVTFTSDRAGSVYYATGRQFDLYGAAADLLDAVAATKMLAFDFSEDNQSFRRSQQVDLIRKVATEYRAKSWPKVASHARSDLGEPDLSLSGRYWRTDR